MTFIVALCLALVAFSEAVPVNYDFAYDVSNSHSRKEVADGNVIKGSYTVVDANGVTRTVHYTADDQNGFVANVEEAHHEEEHHEEVHHEEVHSTLSPGQDDGSYHPEGEDGSYHHEGEEEGNYNKARYEVHLEGEDDGSYHEHHESEGSDDGSYHHEAEDGSYHKEGEEGSYHHEGEEEGAYRVTRDDGHDDGQYHESYNPLRLVPVPAGGYVLPAGARGYAAPFLPFGAQAYGTPYLPYAGFPYHPYGYQVPYGLAHPFNYLRI